MKYLIRGGLFKILFVTLSSKNMASRIKIKTTEGDIIVRLYDETPQHRDNFIKLASEGYFIVS